MNSSFAVSPPLPRPSHASPLVRAALSLVAASLLASCGETVPIGPDLEVRVFTAPASARVDEPIGDDVVLELTNIGTDDIPGGTSVSIGFYFSEDDEITTGDRLLQGGRENLAPNGLAAGETIVIPLASIATISSTFPDGSPPTGAGFIGVVVDEQNQLEELDESNNTASRPIQVLPSGPDLEVSAFTAPETATHDVEFGANVFLEIRNAGSEAIVAGTSIPIGFYVSTDDEITTGDRLLQGGRENLSPNGLAAGETIVIPLASIANVSSTFPDGLPPVGNVFIGVVLDELDDLEELDETNNTAALPIEVLASGPDLVVSTFTAPASVELDEAFGSEVFLEIRNAGNEDIGTDVSVPIGFYISTDDEITTGDRLLQGGRENLLPNGLAAGETIVIPLSSVANVSSTFPDDAPPLGDVFIGVVLDEPDDLEELDETNNVAFQAIQIAEPAPSGPDLEVSVFTGPTTVDLDAAFGDQVFLEIRNAGDEDLLTDADVSIGFYVSTDDVITTGDRLLQGGREFASGQDLPAGASVVVPLFTGANVSSAFPDDEPPLGDVFFGVVLDESDDFEESDESNNTAVLPIEVTVPSPGLPDLEVSVFTAPASVEVDQEFGADVFLEIRNAGDEDIGTDVSVPIGFYISTDDEVTTSDRLLQGGRENLFPNGLAAGATVVIPLFAGANVSSTLPDAFPPLGDVFIGVVLDEFDAVGESDETNNTAVAPITVTAPAPGLPDLEVSVFTAPATAAHDVAFGEDVFLEIRNAGTEDIVAGTSVPIGFYISTDDDITTSDRLLQGGRENLAPDGLAAGETIVIPLFAGASVSSTFPDASPPVGDVFIGVLLDEFDAVAESDESNNTAAQPITLVAEPGPDLEVSVFTAPSTAAHDVAFGGDVFLEIRNAGTEDIAAGTSVPIGFYISTDDEITTGDRLLLGGRENLAPDGLAAGETIVIPLFSGASVSSTFPDASPPVGDVFIGVLLDEFDAVEESDESNNTAFRAITITP